MSGGASTSSAAQEAPEHDHDGKYDQQMDQRARDVKDQESERPEYE